LNLLYSRRGGHPQGFPHPAVLLRYPDITSGTFPDLLRNFFVFSITFSGSFFGLKWYNLLLID
jgi:hypothetical protein